MMRFIRSLLGCSRREAQADEAARRQMEDHEIAMQAVRLRVDAAHDAAKASERAAHALLRRLSEDTP